MLLAASLSALPLAQAGEGFVRDPESTSTACVAANDTVCLDWAFENFDRYVQPTLEHLLLVGLSVLFGFLIAFGMTVISHGRRWIVPVFTGATGVIYTIPSIALFLLLCRSPAAAQPRR